MKYHFYFIPIQYMLLVKSSHIDTNDTDVFIKYSGHSDLERPISEPVSKQESATVTAKPIIEENKEITQVYDDMTEGVVFIPNEKPVFRNEDIFYNDGMKISDAFDKSRVESLMQGEKIHITETESPKADILFVSGKNNENIEKPATTAKKQDRQNSTVIKKTKNSKNSKLNCTNINCNNTVISVCGGKQENKQYKYRLFLNECYFRKVNCAFQHAANRHPTNIEEALQDRPPWPKFGREDIIFNRLPKKEEVLNSAQYEMVPIENCKNIGAHYLTRPYVIKPIPLPTQKEVANVDARRSFSSRRSLNKGVDGSFCGHECPATCTEDYDPQCAVSSSGQRKVFLNHCKLDNNSCLYKVVWHRRPLTECVGRRKADMTNNRGFIGWMQRVGIVDKRGKLVAT